MIEGNDRKVAIVTGASSGIGLLTAKRLGREGYRVFGTSRRERPDTVRDVEMLTLDVRCGDSVNAFVGRVLETAGRIDILVNNAGVVAVGPAEETAPEEARSMFETNFFGVVRVTDAVLPSMRSRRQGRIVNVGSLAGLIAVPGEAFYSASKFALEGYSEALRHEVAPYGIAVSLVEPGFFATDIYRPSEAPPTRRGIADYDALRSALGRSIERSIERGDDPEKVARRIAGIARRKSPRLRYRVGDDARWAPQLKGLLPEWVFERAIKKKFGIPADAGNPLPGGAPVEARSVEEKTARRA